MAAVSSTIQKLEATVSNESATAELFISGTSKPVAAELTVMVGCVSGLNRLVVKAADNESENLLIVPLKPERKTGAILVKTIKDLEQPWGVAVNKKDQVIVVEGRELEDKEAKEHRENSQTETKQCGCKDLCRVSIFNSQGELIKTFGKAGTKDGEFRCPRGVAVDDEDNIYVVDKMNYRIQKFSPDGETHLASSKGVKGSGQLEFNWPKGIGIHPHSKNVYVTEASNHRVQILKPDLKTFVGVIGAMDKDGRPRKGAGDGEFNMPMGVAFDKTGLVYVSDAVNNRIQVFTKEGKFVDKFGAKGSDNEKLKSPCAVCIDNNNVLYVTESDNYCVSVFKINSPPFHSSYTRPSFLTTFAHRPESTVAYQGGIAVGKQGIVYVSDDGNDDLQLFLV